MRRETLLIRERSAIGLATRVRSLGLLLILASLSAAGESGHHLVLDPRRQYDELAELAAREPHAELPCQVSPEKPSLGFDLRFHSDYHVTVPFKALAEAGGWLKMAARVTPSAETERPAYLVQRFAIPGVAMEGRGDVVLAAGFDLGPGRYRVDWIMSDARERVCLSHWDLEAKPARADLPLILAPNQIVSRPDQGTQPEQDPNQSLQKVKILPLNLSPGKPQESILPSEETAAFCSILRRHHQATARLPLSALVAFQSSVRRKGPLSAAEHRSNRLLGAGKGHPIANIRDHRYSTPAGSAKRNALSGALTNRGAGRRCEFARRDYHNWFQSRAGPQDTS